MTLGRDAPRPHSLPLAGHRLQLAIALIVSAVLVATGYEVLGGSRPTGRAPVASPSAPASIAAEALRSAPSTITPSAVESATDAAPWPDGLPRVLDGVPVFRGNDISAHAALVPDDTPFLIGGYLVFVQSECLANLVPPNPLVPPCPNGWLLQDPSYPLHLVSQYLQLVVGANVPSVPGAWNEASPEVLRVHINDPRASACPAAILQRCRQAVVVEAAVWVGR